ncbi:MAG: hypothetical protein JJD92_07525 [Frankiaceae bacterium]|nr:hypothetical protein [Frankiaceae bacterium]
MSVSDPASTNPPYPSFTVPSAFSVPACAGAVTVPFADSGVVDVAGVESGAGAGAVAVPDPPGAVPSCLLDLSLGGGAGGGVTAW